MRGAVREIVLKKLVKGKKVNKLRFKLALLILLVASLQFASACGCGMALAPLPVFKSLKESSAFLVVEAQENGSFYLKPFFRFVSLDEEKNVTMVFPLKAVPREFEAKRITLQNFREAEGIPEFERESEKQSLSGALKELSAPAKGALLFYSLGAVISVPFTLLTNVGVIGSDNESDNFLGAKDGALAHYSFEGGSLDIYNASASGTLSDLVAKTGFKSEGKVKELVDKYKDYFVAVLELEVPTPLPKGKMDTFRNSCSWWYNASREAMQESGKVNLEKLGLSYYDLLEGSGGLCKKLAVEFVSNAAGAMLPDSERYYYRRYEKPAQEPKGILLKMGFSPSDKVFYPISIVESYDNPVANQNYFVKTPERAEFQFSSSVASKTALVGGNRWYLIAGTKDDLEGKIADKGILTGASDAALNFWKFLYENAFLIVALLYLAAISMISLLAVRENDSGVKWWYPLALGVLFPVALSWKAGNKKLAAVCLASWLVFLILALF